MLERGASIPLQITVCGESLPYKPAKKRLFPRVAIYFRDGLGERHALGASMHGVLRVGTLLNAAWTHESRKALALIHFSRGMHIEQSHLADDGRAHELVVLIHLRANLQAVPASDAIRKRIALFLHFRRHARPFAEIVSAINRNPRLHALQALKHKLSVNREIAHQRKLRHRLDSNRLFELIHQRRTRHTRFSINQHRARPANLFQAIRIVGDWSGFFAIASNRVLGNVAQTNNHVHRRPPLESKFLPPRLLFRPRLPFYFDDHLFCFCHSPSPTLASAADPSLLLSTLTRRTAPAATGSSKCP